MINKKIAHIFERMAVYLEIKEDNIFKIRAYRKAAETLSNLSEDLTELKSENRLSSIPGLGEKLISKINEFIDTGKITAYEKMTKEIPESILDIVDIPSVGPRTAGMLYKR